MSPSVLRSGLWRILEKPLHATTSQNYARRHLQEAEALLVRVGKVSNPQEAGQVKVPEWYRQPNQRGRHVEPGGQFPSAKLAFGHHRIGNSYCARTVRCFNAGVAAFVIEPPEHEASREDYSPAVPSTKSGKVAIFYRCSRGHVHPALRFPESAHYPRASPARLSRRAGAPDRCSRAPDADGC